MNRKTSFGVWGMNIYDKKYDSGILSRDIILSKAHKAF